MAGAPNVVGTRKTFPPFLSLDRPGMGTGGPGNAEVPAGSGAEISEVWGNLSPRLRSQLYCTYTGCS